MHSCQRGEGRNGPCFVMGQVWLFFVLCQKQGIDPATGRSPLQAVGFHPSDALCDYSELNPLSVLCLRVEGDWPLGQGKD